MIKRSLVFILIIYSFVTNAQTIKTDVLVIGSSASGVAAAIQCARSKVKTVLADNGLKMSGVTAGGQMVSLEMNSDIPSGIWGEFRKRVREVYTGTAGYDTTQNAPLKFEPGMGTSVLKKISDTVKNLTIRADCKFTNIKKDGDRWEVTLTQNGNKLTVKARVVVDATEDGAIATKAGGKLQDGFEDFKEKIDPKTFRTSITAWEGMVVPTIDGHSDSIPSFPVYFIPVKAALVQNVENILATRFALQYERDIRYLPLRFQFGQGAGTIAAFCAFFKTSTRHLDVRTIQGELLDFKGYLLPFADISQHNSSWRAVQQVGATGMLPGKWKRYGIQLKFVFLPDSAVTTAEVEPILKEIYTRAFLWFNKEKPGEKFTVGNTLSFISEITLTEPAVLNKSMQRAWKNQYKFKSDFDINRPISRLEFTVLANKFLNPFARTVDLNGRLVN